MKKFILLCLFITLIMGSSISRAAEYSSDNYKDEAKFAISAKAGTLGGGIELTTSLIPNNINARLGANAMQFDFQGTESDIKYEFDVEFYSGSALIDWYPIDSPFRISAGGLLNKNSIDMKAKTASSFKIGNSSYSNTEVGTLTGELDFDDFSPYVGIGWGNPLKEKGAWSFSLDVGIMYQNNPNVTLSTDGTLSTNANFLANLTREKQTLEDGLDDFEVYPVVMIGASYSF